LPKPIQFTEVSSSGSGFAEYPSARLILIQTGANLGFAGGNNVGLRYALQQGDCDFAWLLNNDTVVKPDALSQMVCRMEENVEAGICGSTLLYYDAPSIVQACGGSVYCKWLARGGNIGNLTKSSELPASKEVERQMAYVIGASMLVRRRFIEQVGLMSEQYFLTFEEIDWVMGAKGRFQLAYSPSSIVYHKEGGALGSHRLSSQRSALSEFYATRNRLLFTRKHYPIALPMVLAAIAISGMHRLLTGRWGNFSALAKGIYRGLTKHVGSE
jgi:GT2 family glycosyltransferase